MSKPSNSPNAKKGDPPPTNMTYLKEWDEYSATKGSKKQTLLLPITIGIDKKGQIVRKRIREPEVRSLYRKFRKDIPAYIFSESHLFPDPDEVFEEMTRMTLRVTL